jgi:hypothetical protein
MAPKESFIEGIFYDEIPDSEELNPHPAYAMTPAELTAVRDAWIRGVRATLRLLHDDMPCATSRAIFDGIKASGKAVTIVPSATRPVGPDRRMGNAYAEPDDFQTATAPGKMTENYRKDPRLGVGGGSNSTIYFNPQDWDSADSTPVTFKAVDEVLLHELVHALRQTLGQEDNARLPPPRSDMGLGGATELEGNPTTPWPAPTTITQVYNNVEEFVAILITNIYRSENRRDGLVRDHLGPQPLQGEPPDTPEHPFRDPEEKTTRLGWPLTKPRNFMTLWKPQISQLFRDLDRVHVATKIANVACDFNPFAEFNK